MHGQYDTRPDFCIPSQPQSFTAFWPAIIDQMNEWISELIKRSIKYYWKSGKVEIVKDGMLQSCDEEVHVQQT